MNFRSSEYVAEFSVRTESLKASIGVICGPIGLILVVTWFIQSGAGVVKVQRCVERVIGVFVSTFG